MIDAVFEVLGGAATSSAAKPDDQDDRTPWVLLIDDDADYSAALKCRLENCGVAVVRAFNGMEGYRMAFTHSASAILLDYNVPSGQGDYILGRLKDNPATRDIPVIMLTGVRDKWLERKMYGLGASAFLTKPVKFETLRSILARHINILSARLTCSFGVRRSKGCKWNLTLNLVASGNEDGPLMALSTIRVLLIEDDSADALLIRKSLGRSSIPFQVEHFDRLAQLESLTWRPEVDVVLLDLGLPDGIGVRNRCTLAEIDDRVPIVIHTAQNDETSALEAMKAGAQDFLTKDLIDDRHLVRSLTYAIHRKRTELGLRDGARQLEAESRIDSLTRVFNRAGDVRIPRSRMSAVRSRSKTPFCCAVLDVDYFKRFNDTYGHAIGDEMLVSVSELVGNQVRAHDIVCRFGGEEFCVLLPATSENAAALWAERTRQAIHAATIPTSRGPLQMTVSVGVAQSSSEHAVRRASCSIMPTRPCSCRSSGAATK